MRLSFWNLMAFLLVAAVAPVMTPAQATDISVTGIRLGENAGTTRLVLDISEHVSYQTLHLSDPYRIVLDMPEIDWKVGAGSGTGGGTGGGEGQGAIARYRYGLFRDGVSRLVLDLDGAAVVDRIFVLQPQGKYPYRLVIDLKPVGREEFLLAMKTSRPDGNVRRTARAAPPPRIGDSTNNRRRIIIDAGHGGIDPGNLGVIGVPEKTIVLNMALAMKREIERRSKYEVILTRDRDIYIPHRERVAIARHAQADLFISVHADSLTKSKKNAKVRGATIYTLSEIASDREAAALARKENRSDLIAGVDLAGESDEVTNILIDLAQRETMNFSARFANLLIPELRGRVPLRKNAHRFAGFIVLKAPDVPSVLFELGYLSNRQDARSLNSSDGRKKISSAVAVAVQRYFETTTAVGY